MQTPVRHLLFIALVFLPITLPAQHSIIGYYKLTCDAELAICHKDLPAASALYTKAFALNPDKPFTRDLLNACICAMDLKNYSAARKHVRRIMTRGLSEDGMRHLRYNFSGQDLDSVKLWLAVFPNDTNKSNGLVATIRKMHKTDQDTRDYFIRKHDGQYMVDSVFDMDEMHGHVLAELFRANGVPNEDAGSLDHDIPSEPSFYLLAKHHAGGYAATPKRACHELDTLLFKAIFSYDLHPHSFLSLLFVGEAQSTDSPFRYGSFVLRPPLSVPYIRIFEDKSIYPQYFAPDVEARTNQLRASIGLEPLSELREKLLFHKAETDANSPYKRYSLTEGIAQVFDADSHEDADKYIAEFELYKPK